MIHIGQLSQWEQNTANSTWKLLRSNRQWIKGTSWIPHMVHWGHRSSWSNKDRSIIHHPRAVLIHRTRRMNMDLRVISARRTNRLQIQSLQPMVRAKLSYSTKPTSMLGSKKETAIETSFSISKQERRKNQQETKSRSECRFLIIKMLGSPTIRVN